MGGPVSTILCRKIPTTLDFIPAESDRPSAVYHDVMQRYCVLSRTFPVLFPCSTFFTLRPVTPNIAYCIPRMANAIRSESGCF